MKTHSRTIICGMAMLAASLTSAEVTAGWNPIVDLNPTDAWSNPGYPKNQSSVAVATYLQDLLNLPDAPLLRGQSDRHGGVLSGLGNPSAPDLLLLALHFGNGNDHWVHDGPFNVFFSCQSDCDSFTSPTMNGLGNYRLYATGAAPSVAGVLADPAIAVAEPGSMALLGVGLIALGFLATRRHKQ